MANRIPITRNNKFFSEEDFELEQEFGMEYLSDINQTIILYRVDRRRTDTDDLYGEVKREQIKFYPPIEVHCVAEIEAAENTSYNSNGSLRRLEPGNLVVGVFEKHLKELDVDIKYGDYIGYVINETTIKFYTVSDDGKVNYENPKMIGGYKPAYRNIVCVPADENEFKG